MMTFENETRQAVDKQVGEIFRNAADFDVTIQFLREWLYERGLGLHRANLGSGWYLQQTNGINVSQHVYLIDALRAAFAWVEEHHADT